MEQQELLKPTQIVRSKRKSLSLIIKNNGDFVVRVPLKYKEEDIFKFIDQKKNWIIKKRLEQKSLSYEKLTFQNDDRISILGKNNTIFLYDGPRVKIDETGLYLPKINSKEKLIAFLKRFAKEYIIKRVKLIAELFGFDYASISISSARTNWGSCSHINKLHFTYKLIMCPEDVIDYVVLHELCHTKVKNHSRKFWELVGSCNPNYKKFDKWLKKNRGIIEII